MAVPNSYLSGLNPQQRRAVEQTEGPVLVLAGAGSGKTRVITRRIAHILAQGLAAPDQILAMTFTNKAAAEMTERVAELVGRSQVKGMQISTFHSFCLQVLRKHCERLGYRRNFSIAGESDARTLLRRVTDELGTQNTRYDPGAFQSAISLYKNSGMTATPGQVLATAKQSPDEKYQEHLATVMDAYQSALRAANSIDFDDLMLLTLRLWREFPDMLEMYQAQYLYVMVDEYQDTNKVQFELLRNLTGKKRNLCVVGDDDQSIYGWRGADVRNILDFERQFPKATCVTLDQNYRSTATILNAANSVIANNPARHEKKLWSELGEGRPIDWMVVGDEEEEAKEIVKFLHYIRSKTNAPYRDFSVLYRSNIQSAPIEMAFRKAGIPYVVYGGQDFFERAEVKDIICYLKLLCNPRDEAAFLRIVNMPRRGIGDATLHQAHDLCRTQRCSLGKGLAILLNNGTATSQADTGIRQFLGLMKTYRIRFREQREPLHEILQSLVLEIDYFGELERASKTKEHALSRWQNVEHVIRAVQEYEADLLNPSLSDFLDQSHLNSSGESPTKEERKREGVSLMTIHSAKGLEFPYVFVAGMEDGILPHQRAIKENSLEEERRLFYVALTRGQRHVILMEALTRNQRGKERLSKTSRFLREIPENLLNQRIFAARDMAEAALATAPPAPRKPRPRRKSG